MNKYLIDIKPYFQTKMLAILAWSFASGLPLMLVMGTLSAYLIKSQATLEMISLFGFAALPYSLKYLLAPFIQNHSIPLMRKYVGRVRSWMIVSMLGIILGLIGIGSISLTLESGFWELFFAVFWTSLCSTVNDTAEAEYRIELLQKYEFSHGMACYSIGYRLGMITGGSVALFIATFFSWQFAYYAMAFLMTIGLCAVVLQSHAKEDTYPLEPQPLWHQYLNPILKLTNLPGWLGLLIIIMIYNFSDNMLNMMLNPFLIDMGMSLAEIGMWQGGFGGILSIFGGVLSGFLLSRYGLFRILFFSLLLLMVSHVLLILLAMNENTKPLTSIAYHLFYSQAIFGNFCTGMSATAYITFLAHQCKKPYIASQNAFLTSLMAGAKAIFVACSGYLVVMLGWTNFFVFITVVSLVILMLIYRYRDNITMHCYSEPDQVKEQVSCQQIIHG